VRRNSACDTQFAAICRYKDCRAQKNNPDEKSRATAAPPPRHRLEESRDKMPGVTTPKAQSFKAAAAASSR